MGSIGNIPVAGFAGFGETGRMEAEISGRLDTVRIESARYEKICKGLKVAEQAALRNRYTLDIYKQTNELFHYPVKLLEVLEVYDSTKTMKNVFKH